MSASEEHGQGPVIKDRRRIDPVTGQPRHPAQSSGAADPEGGQAGSAQPEGAHAGQVPRVAGQQRPGKHAVSKPGLRAEAAGSGQEAAGPGEQRVDGDADAIDTASRPDLSGRLAERTADLQRVQAEYANYRKRVERDRAAVREYALASVLAELLPVLDDIGRAREHGELTGGFKSVAESLEATTVKLGLTAFGEVGETFDPNVHEALMHAYSGDVTEPTCVQILQPGYRVGERVLRPARVAVAEPTDPSGARTGDATADFAQSDADVDSASEPEPSTGGAEEAEDDRTATTDEAAGQAGADGPSGTTEASGSSDTADAASQAETADPAHDTQ